MSGARALVVITHLTLHEAARRRVLAAALVCGGAFLALYAVGLHFIVRDLAHPGVRTQLERRMVLDFMTLAGLYAVHFLTVMAAVLLPVDTLAGEIASGVMQTLAAKPVPRSAIVLGKWLAFALVLTGYLALMAGGVLAVSRLEAGFTPPGIARGLPLMLLAALALLSLSVAGGTRFSTVTNGVVAFGLYGLAFVGSWVEQVATFANNDAARDVGTVASLILPSESLWELAAWHMQPPLMRELHLTPFSPASVPTPAMVVWAAAWTALAVAVALRGFARRPL